VGSALTVAMTVAAAAEVAVTGVDR